MLRVSGERKVVRCSKLCVGRRVGGGDVEIADGGCRQRFSNTRRAHTQEDAVVVCSSTRSTWIVGSVIGPEQRICGRGCKCTVDYAHMDREPLCGLVARHAGL